jgi:hypothetical protein
MRRFSLTVIFFFFVCIVNAQQLANDIELKLNINTTAELMAGYFIKKDFKEFIKFLYEPMLKFNGGTEKVISDIENEIKDFEKDSLKISNMTFNSISKLIHIKGQIQCTIVEKMELTTTDLLVTLKSTLIAISSDQGKTWKFIDPFGMSLKQLRTYLPELSPDITLPNQEEPIITEK